jgi:hypothetical protein
VGIGTASTATEAAVITTSTLGTSLAVTNTSSTSSINGIVSQVNNSSSASNAIYGLNSGGGVGSTAIKGSNTSSTSSAHYGGDFSATSGSLGYGIAASGGEADIYAKTTGRIDVEESSDLGTPQSGIGRFGFKTDGLPYGINDAGTEYVLANGVKNSPSSSTSYTENYTEGDFIVLPQMTGATSVTVQNIPDGATGTISVQQGSSLYSLTLVLKDDAGTPATLTQVRYTTASDAIQTASKWTKIVYTRMGSNVEVAWQHQQN